MGGGRGECWQGEGDGVGAEGVFGMEMPGFLVGGQGRGKSFLLRWAGPDMCPVERLPRWVLWDVGKETPLA